MNYTNDRLLDSIKDRAFFPVGQNTFEDSDILRIASEIIESELLPKILQARQEFYVTYSTLSPTRGTNDTYYWIRIPQRAVGQAIICVKDTDDNEVHHSDYWIEGSKIYFDGEVDSSYRVYYYLRPGKLVEVSDCAVITNINTTTGAVTCSSLPSTFTTGIEYDFVRAKAGFDILGVNITPTSVSSNSVTFNVADLPSELAVGDYIALADESPIPQIPVEWFSYLALLTAIQVLESLSEYDAVKIAMQRLQRIERNALSLISPRIERKAKAIIRPFDSD